MATLTILPPTNERVIGDVTTVEITEGRMIDGKLVETPKTLVVELVKRDDLGAYAWGVGITVDGGRYVNVYLGLAA